MTKELYGENYFLPDDKLPKNIKSNYWDSVYPLLIREADYFNKQTREVWQRSCEEHVIKNCFNVYNAVITAVE